MNWLPTWVRAVPETFKPRAIRLTDYAGLCDYSGDFQPGKRPVRKSDHEPFGVNEQAMTDQKIPQPSQSDSLPSRPTCLYVDLLDGGKALAG